MKIVIVSQGATERLYGVATFLHASIAEDAVRVVINQGHVWLVVDCCHVGLLSAPPTARFNQLYHRPS